MGIVLMFVGVLVAIGGWVMLVLGIGIVETETVESSSGGLPYLSETVAAIPDAAIPDNIILLGYVLMIMGAILWGFARLYRLLDTLSSAPEPAAEPAATPPSASGMRPGRSEDVARAPSEPSMGAGPGPALSSDIGAQAPEQAQPTNGGSDEPRFERRAQIVRDGIVEGRRLIEYENGMADVETSQGWRRFKTVDEAVAFLRG